MSSQHSHSLRRQFELLDGRQEPFRISNMVQQHLAYCQAGHICYHNSTPFWRWPCCLWSPNRAKVTLDLLGGGCSIQDVRVIQPLGCTASSFQATACFSAFRCCASLDNSSMICKSYDHAKSVLKSRVIRLPHTAAFVVLSTSQLELGTKNKPALKVRQGPQIARVASHRRLCIYNVPHFLNFLHTNL